MEPIAILTDSGTDVPKALVERWGIHVLPLTIQYEALSYRDGVDITTNQVLDRLELEIPKTSLPSVGDAVALLRDLRDRGVRRVMVVTISSALSGTYAMLRMVAGEFPEMDIRVLDTKNIGIGAGVFAIRAAELAAEGMPLERLEKTLRTAVPRTKVFFSMDTLRYLQKGGRISAASAAVGNLLGVRPVLSCDRDGACTTVKKVRGSAASMEAAVDLAVRAAAGLGPFRLLVAHAGAEKRARMAAEMLQTRLPGASDLIVTDIGPALAVHSGPGLVGVGVHGLPGVTF